MAMKGGSEDSNGSSDGFTIHVSNIPYSAQLRCLRQAFMSYGEIRYITIIRDKYTGQSKGYGFVCFKNKADMIRALELHKKIDIYGRKLVINIAHSCKRKTETNNFEVNEEECYIKLLNEDCLRLIFSLLNFKELTVISRVCKRWYDISRSARNALKSLKLDFHNCSNLPVLRVNLLKKMLYNCTQLLDLDMAGIEVTGQLKSLGSVIGNCCPHLEKITLGPMPACNIGVHELSKKCPNLKEFISRDGFYVQDSSLISLLQNCKLEKLVLQRTEYLTGKSFKFLPSTLSVLDLSSCCQLRSDLMNKIADRCTGLTALYLNHLPVRATTIDLFCRSLTKLEILSLNDLSNNDDFTFKDIGQLKCLHTLKLINISDGTVGLHNIFMCSSLKNLELCGIRDSSTGGGFSHLVSLQSLESLKLDDCLEIDQIQYLSQLRSLKTLSLQTNFLDDDSVFAILNGQSRLNELDIRDNPDVTDVSLVHAAEYVNTKNTTLVLKVSPGLLNLDISLPSSLTVVELFGGTLTDLDYYESDYDDLDYDSFSDYHYFPYFSEPDIDDYGLNDLSDDDYADFWPI